MPHNRSTAGHPGENGVRDAAAGLGNKHFAPEGPSVLIVDRATGERAEPIVVDRISGRPLGARDFRWIAGPAANERMRERYSVTDCADRAPERPARRTRQRAAKRRSP